jgi:hypothetical protein
MREREPFADEIFAECSLPSVTLGKAFAECKMAFAECFRHSAKNAIPVVRQCSVTTFTHVVTRNDQLSSRSLACCLMGTKKCRWLHWHKRRTHLHHMDEWKWIFLLTVL